MNDLIENLLLAGLLFGSVAVGFFIVTRAHRPPYVLLASIAGRWKGKVLPGGIFSGSRIEILVDDVSGLVTFGESGIGKPGGYMNTRSPGWTRVRLDWPSERRLRVVPEGFGSRLRRLLGGSEMKFDDPFFDDRYWIESSHPTWAREILDDSARRGFAAFRRSDIALDVGPAGIDLRAAQVLVDDAESLGSFIELGVRIMQKMKGLMDAAGVKLEPVLARSGSACPVCGHAVADAIFPCPACRTPHHRDCWKYFGGCALFGCRKIR